MTNEETTPIELTSKERKKLKKIVRQQRREQRRDKIKPIITTAKTRGKSSIKSATKIIGKSSAFKKTRKRSARIEQTGAPGTLVSGVLGFPSTKTTTIKRKKSKRR